MPLDYSIGRRLMADFQRDYGMSVPQAAGMVGNLAHESNNFRQLQEAKPLIPGSRGGWGFAQWTGPRRRAFEQFASEKGLSPSSYDANYGFLRHELDNTREGRFMTNLMRTNDVGAATTIVQDQFLRPGVPHTDSRMRYAQMFAQLGGDPNAVMPSAPSPAPAMNFNNPYGLASSGAGGDGGAAMMTAMNNPLASLNGLYGVAAGGAAGPYQAASAPYGVAPVPGGLDEMGGQRVAAPIEASYGVAYEPRSFG